MTTSCLELHILQTYPSSRLNRGEDGSAKSIYFGGSPRLRISSQAQKRAERHHPHLRFGTPQGVRTKQPQDVILQVLTETNADLVKLEQTPHVIRTALSALYGEYDDKNRLKTPVFLGDDELHRIAALLAVHLGRVTSIQDDRERTAAALLLLRDLRSGTASPDLALYGRFVASQDGWDIEAATSYTHAISTHRANNVTDFFTAVDDLTGDSLHLGQMDISAPTMYRTAVLDISQLQRNLPGGDVQTVIRMWATRAVSSTPNGGRHGTFASTQPEYVLLVVRRGGQPLTYAPAFEQAVYRDQHRSIAQVSAERLEDYARRLPLLYGQNGQVSAQRVTLLTLPVPEHDSIETASSLTAALDVALKELQRE
ncbi:type I-E CRISPR-associated protein Cas7/Cse4/CasC [Deinococcus ruber]|uniref:Type I-E CRISPR-associated protein Cas7/Cse4/CasC n=1 Tax=Deinococcus ruber TaxID=1848197 RepID=A0A918CDN1_9DEIO|nr:type I-E CRISPR-associated protein Cas7/Cse4/CasC [Deinococcus ruber]GGR17704.1 type I-E CRISPR-associated protein Cas7/Cse4/CasC [Deinococcus ruber]